MAYVALADKGLGDLLPADDWNQLLDNVEAGPAALAQARGDLFEGAGLNELQRIAVGSTGTVIRARSTGNVYEAPLSVTPADLDDASDDDKLILWGAAREAFLPVAQLYNELNGTDRAINPGGEFDLTLPTGVSFSDVRWIMFVVGPTANSVAETLWAPVGAIPAAGTMTRLYGISNATNLVYTINENTGVATRVGTGALGVTQPLGLTNHLGTLLCIERASRIIYSINNITGVATEFYDPSLTSGDGSALASHNGLIYFMVSNSLYSYDPTTDTLVNVGTSGGTGLTSHNGDLLSVTSGTGGHLNIVNLSNGNITQFPNSLGVNSPNALASYLQTLYIVGTGNTLYSVNDVSGVATEIAALSATGMQGLASYSGLMGIGDWLGLEKEGTNTLKVYPQRSGYLHQVATIL